MIEVRVATAVVLLASVSAVQPAGAQQVGEDPQLPPVGMGTLRQEDIAVRLDAGSVQLRVLPLNELILRLLATDSYSALHSLREARTEEADSVSVLYGGDRELFLVTIFAAVEQAQFDPELLTIISRNRLFRPIRILPTSPLWSQHRLIQRETATAVYVFEDGIAILEPFTVEYGGIRSDQWGSTLRRIERERARIQARIRS